MASTPSETPSAPGGTKVRRQPREVVPARVKGKDLMHLSRQLAAFLRAGIPILDGLSMLSREAANPTLRRTLAAVAEDIGQGLPLADAFERHPKVFPPAYRSMIRSAELSGRLDSVLDRLTVYIERDVEARGKIRSAMIYPTVIAVLATAVCVLLVTFVLPKFRVFFASFHQRLPLPTRMLLWVSDAVHHWWWLVLLTVAALAGLAVAVLRTDRGRMLRDRGMLRLPVLGVALRYSIVERFSRVLGAMLQAGVSLADAVDIAGEATGHRPTQRAIVRAREDMLAGGGIAGPLADTGVFPAPATQMLRVGEDTGSLDEQLDAVAAFYERELDYKVKQITTLLEPAVLVVMGSIVGFVALALVSAMYGIYGHMAS